MAGPLDSLLGRLAVERAWLTPGQVEEALVLQERERPHPPLGVVLVERGFLTHAQVGELLDAQAAASARAPEAGARADAWRFGSVALALELATPAQVNVALREQARREEAGEAWCPLGEILVEQGGLGPSAVAEVLRAQEAARVLPAAPPGSEPAATVRPEARTVLRTRTAASASAAADTAAPATAAGARPETRRFGKYEFVQELGRGGMGVVYKAWHPGLKSYFAVKVLLAGQDASSDDVKRFQREAQAAARLKHPGILTVHDIAEEDGKTWFAMEYVEGASLDKVIRNPVAHGLAPGRSGGVSVAAAMRIVRDVAEAVQAAHDAGIVHRDLKPANVLRLPDGRVKVMDFGLAKLVDAGGTAATRTGALMGTPAYMSPEQADGNVREVDARSDVYQLGAILYELLTGRLPYVGRDALDVVIRVLTEDPEPPRRREPSIDRDAETICLKAMAREKGKRYASARELAEECGRFLAGDPIRARRESWWEKAARWGRRRKALVGLGAVAALALGAAAGAAWFAHGAQREQERLEREVLENLRTIAKSNLDSVLMLRRAGGKMSEVAEKLLPTLEDAVRKAVERAPQLAEPHYRLGRMYRAMMRFADAQEEQEAALAKEPDYAPSLYERAILGASEYRDRLQRLREQWLMAEGARLAAAGALDPGSGSDPRPWENPAEDELVLADLEARRLRKGIETDVERLSSPSAELSAEGLSPAQRTFARGLGRQVSDRGDENRTAARTLFEQARKADPGLEEAVVACADEAGDLERTIEIYTAAMEADKGYVPFRIYRGGAFIRVTMVLRQRGRDPSDAFSAAIADCDRALELAPESFEARMNRCAARVNWGLDRMNRDLDPGEQLAAAIAGYGDVLQLRPNLVDAWVFRGLARSNWGLHRGRHGADPAEFYDAALSDYDRALELDPSSAEVRKQRGRTRTLWGLHRAEHGIDPGPHYAVAIADLGRALSLDPKSAELWMLRGQVQDNWGVYRASRGADPDELYAAAIADLDRAVATDPGLGEAWVARGTTHINWGIHRSDRGGDPSELHAAAIADCDKAVDLDPADPDAWATRGKARTTWGLYRQLRGDDPRELYAAAMSDFGKALELAPASAATWVRRGTALLFSAALKHGDGSDPGDAYAAAIADYDRALQLDPTRAEAWQGRGDARGNWADHRHSHGADAAELLDLAEADLSKSLELDPGSGHTFASRSGVRLIRGLQILRRGGDPDESFDAAIADSTKALEINPQSARDWMRRGRARSLRAEAREKRGVDVRELFAAALADFDKALELDSTCAEFWWRRAVALADRGLVRSNAGSDAQEFFRAALRNFDQALELDPRSAETWSLRGKVRLDWSGDLRRRGLDPSEQFAAAIADQGRALERNPNVAEYWIRRGDARLNWGSFRLDHGADPGELYDAAIADYHRAVELAPASAGAWMRRGMVHMNRGEFRTKRGLDPRADYAAAVVDLEAALRFDPNCPSDVRAWIEYARARTAPSLSTGSAAWQVSLQRGEALIQTGDYAAGGDALAEGIAAFESAGAGLDEQARAARLDEPGVRAALVHAHYNRACGLALAASGRSGPRAESKPVPQDEAARLRDGAFRHLADAIRLGWKERAHLEGDADLAPLHADPRWPALLAQLDSASRK